MHSWVSVVKTAFSTPETLRNLWVESRPGWETILAANLLIHLITFYVSKQAVKVPMVLCNNSGTILVFNIRYFIIILSVLLSPARL